MFSVVVGSATITYPKEITFLKGKKAAFSTGDITITNSDGSQLSYKAVKISKSTKAGSTSFKIKSPSGDKTTAKLIKKYKFPVTIVPYEVSTKDSVTVNINTKGVLKSVLVNGIKLKKSEFSGTEDSLTFSGRFTGNWFK